MSKVQVAIIGSGNIGTDLMMKIINTDNNLEMKVLVGIDPDSDGLARARKLGITAIDQGVEGLTMSSEYENIRIVFDATSAKAHAKHAEVLGKDGKQLIDLTPAAIGPYVVPTANLDEHLDRLNVNMVTCGGQATIPIVRAVSDVVPVHYGEIVASIASKSAGPGTRANIDEFTETTARGIEVIGRAKKGKAIIILNPAEPPLIMRDTVYTLSEVTDQEKIRASIHQTIKAVQKYVPGYRLKQEVQFDLISPELLASWHMPGVAGEQALKTSVFLEVEGAGHYLPTYAGNLDIMTSAALATANRLASTKFKEV